MNKPKTYNRVKQRAKELRKTPTTAEQILWVSLRNRKLSGLQVIRVGNEEVEKDLERVLGKIAVACGMEYPSPKLG